MFYAFVFQFSHKHRQGLCQDTHHFLLWKYNRVYLGSLLQLQLKVLFQLSLLFSLCTIYIYLIISLSILVLCNQDIFEMFAYTYLGLIGPISRLLFYLYTVSYTHLDVYKRQALTYNMLYLPTFWLTVI